MIRTVLAVAGASVGSLTSTAPDREPLAELEGTSFDKLNVLSLLAQAGYAFHKGNAKRGALLLGAATIAPKSREASYLVQGVVTLDSIRRRLT